MGKPRLAGSRLRQLPYGLALLLAVNARPPRPWPVNQAIETLGVEAADARAYAVMVKTKV